ncbi:H/ACA RNA-protein complex component Gar1 [Halobacteriales archaeon QS_1_68_17]|jgi:RNA-binding protein|nr:MAG: H/ACA RNA-protein complex component Gar1 [Halobacteriales archaeon QS_1_68_17]
MRRLGEVVRVAGGTAVVRCSEADPPEIGARVTDDQLTELGRVVDVFGPVERPYAAVSPDAGVRLPPLLGTTLYAR